MTADLYRRMLPVFVAEAEQRLDTMHEATGMLALAPNDGVARDAIARAVHTIKGNAAMLGLSAIVRAAERLERAWPITAGSHGTAAIADLHAGRCELRALVREVSGDLPLVAAD